MQNQSELAKFDPYKAEVQQFVAPALQIKVTDKDSADGAMTKLRQVKDLSDRLEARRDEMVRPHNEVVKSINGYAKEIKAPLLEAQQHLKTCLADWERKLEKERLEALRKADEEKKRAEKEAADKLKAQQENASIEDAFKTEDELARDRIVQNVEHERTTKEIAIAHHQATTTAQSNKVSGARKVWKFEVTDANKVPAEFMIPDEKAIRLAVAGGARKIEGVRIYEDVNIAVR